MSLTEMIVALGIFVLVPIMFVAQVVRARINATNKRTEIALAAIEKNSDIDLEVFFKKMTPPRRSLKEKLLNRLLCGCIFTILGICIYIAIFVDYEYTGWSSDKFVGISFVAGPSLGIGLAFLINYFVGRRVLKQEMEAETPKREMEIEDKKQA